MTVGQRLAANLIAGDLREAVWTGMGVDGRRRALLSRADAGAFPSRYIWINGVETRWKGTPFGGYKNSAPGSEHSIEEMESYTRMKAVNVLLQ